MRDGRWEFWIDVGGTFTDCVARAPDGCLLTHKLLSNGAYKGRAAAGSSAGRIVDPRWRTAPPGFFDGFRLELDGAATNVVHFDRAIGALSVDPPVPADPTPGGAYQLLSGEPAPVTGIRWLLGKRLDEPIGPVRVRLGTTRGTNALLERNGAPTAFVTTAGFGDVLRIGYQDRPKLFELNVRKPVELYRAVVEVDERIAADGTVLTPLDETQVRERLAPLRAAGIMSLAVCLMNAYRNPAHERAVGRIAAQLGLADVSLSSSVSPLQRIVPRGDTTVVDAYVTPVIRRYVEAIRRCLPEASIKLMTSSGGLADAKAFSGRDSILSGPAGGVVGCAAVARRAGLSRVIGLDMGGTSTDVSRWDGQFERRFEMRLRDDATRTSVRIVAPMLAIETVAAGGGSICGFDGVKPTVGPRSAGAEPGPACYGRGGPLCVTDLNVLLGRIPPAHFAFPLDVPAAERRLDELIETIAAATETRYRRESLAAGLIAIANEHMAAAIRRVSIARGYDVRDYALVAFGGAGGQHACAIADLLGIRTIVMHPLAGVLSAYGIGMADVRVHAARDVGRPYDAAEARRLAAVFAEVELDLRREIAAQGADAADVLAPARSLDLRYHGQDSVINVPQPADGDYAASFERLHRQLYGFAFDDRPVEIRALRVELVANPNRASEPSRDREGAGSDPSRDRKGAGSDPSRDRKGAVAPVESPGRRHHTDPSLPTPVYARDELRPCQHVMGPAIIVEPTGTIVIDRGWHAKLCAGGEIVIERPKRTTARGPVPGRDRQGTVLSDRTSTQTTAPSRSRLGSEPAPSRSRLGSVHRLGRVDRLGSDAARTSGANSPTTPAPDPILLELFNNRFAAVAEQMGTTLARTALSTNVKERLDFSCAIFDADGGLVVNAPHIPVHLGSMSQCVRELAALVPDMRPGDVYVTNHPLRGGTHLPDVTVVTPVYAADGRKLHFYTASRAHHAEIGGVTPGSMPPLSRTLAEEGVVIDAFRLVRDGTVDEGGLRALLAAGPHPSRRIDENVADLLAQAAANRVGVAGLAAMIAERGLDAVLAYMGHIQQAAERKMRAAIAALPAGRREFTDHMDDGTPIRVAITIQGDSATVDFTGSGPVHPGNLNANRAIVSSAVLYCFRCLIADDIPLNAGVLAPIDIVLPECFLNPPLHADPARCAAVAGGNVETSQRVVDAIFGALRVVAASQGTMNNLTFGDATFGYYETIGGGSGAGPGFDGADAVHVHMTNTRLTDPEVLEDRYPVRLRRFEIRRGSGGTGLQRGGDGIVREIEFHSALTVSLLTQRRVNPPYGLAGGSAGRLGRNTLLRQDGVTIDLPGIAQIDVAAGDVLRIETPGGGGFGAPARSDPAATGTIGL